MTQLLFVSHCPSDNTRAIRDTVLQSLDGFGDVQLEHRDSLEATVEDVERCDALALATTENFGAMAGRTKDFFERIYYPLLDARPSLPVVFYVRAGEDGTGTVTGIQRILTGLKWQLVQPALVLKGSYDKAFSDDAATLVTTLAAGVDAGIF
ncbi:MAG: flavodoxin family protein [Pseudomonadota bacterium]